MAIVIKSDKFFNCFDFILNWLFGTKMLGIALFPFVIIRPNIDQYVILHESIHIEQYTELYIVGFLFIYVYDLIYGYLKYGDRKKAYEKIRFEQEAFMNHNNNDYLKERSKFAWMKYKVC